MHINISKYILTILNFIFIEFVFGNLIVLPIFDLILHSFNLSELKCSESWMKKQRSAWKSPRWMNMKWQRIHLLGDGWFKTYSLYTYILRNVIIKKSLRIWIYMYMYMKLMRISFALNNQNLKKKKTFAALPPFNLSIFIVWHLSLVKSDVYMA